MSLSARRAWIEKNLPSRPIERNEVALRKESVDRKGLEIDGVSYDVVALRKESVDRKDPDGILVFCGPQGRSPQGERG